MKVVKVTSKGQVTIPTRIRDALGITAESHLEVSVEGQEVRLRKIVRTRPLGTDDPIWGLVGVAAGAATDVSVEHDRYLADGEVSSWRGSS